jgi:hypothetical protein
LLRALEISMPTRKSAPILGATLGNDHLGGLKVSKPRAKSATKKKKRKKAKKSKKPSKPPPAPSEEVFHIEKILDKKFDKKSRNARYLISWVGYPASENSWEPKTCISNPEFNMPFLRFELGLPPARRDKWVQANLHVAKRRTGWDFIEPSSAASPATKTTLSTTASTNDRAEAVSRGSVPSQKRRSRVVFTGEEKEEESSSSSEDESPRPTQHAAVAGRRRVAYTGEEKEEESSSSSSEDESPRASARRYALKKRGDDGAAARGRRRVVFTGEEKEEEESSSSSEDESQQPTSRQNACSKSGDDGAAASRKGRRCVAFTGEEKEEESSSSSTEDEMPRPSGRRNALKGRANDRAVTSRKGNRTRTAFSGDKREEEARPNRRRRTSL